MSRNHNLLRARRKRARRRAMRGFETQTFWNREVFRRMAESYGWDIGAARMKALIVGPITLPYEYPSTAITVEVPSGQ